MSSRFPGVPHSILGCVTIQVETEMGAGRTTALPALGRVLLFQTGFWLWFAAYQWVWWPRLDAWRSGVRPQLGWAGLFLDFTWIKAALTLLLLLAAARWLDRRRLRNYGYRADSRALGLIVLGFVLGLVFNALPRLADWAAGGGRLVEWFHVRTLPGSEGVPFAVAILPGFVNVALTAFWEEATFRAHPMKNLAEDPRRGFWAVVLPAALYFALAHALTPTAGSGFDLLARCCMGLILGSLYYATGELALPMGVHAGGNFAVFSLFQEGPDANACFVRLTPTETHAPHLYAVPVVLGATLAAVIWARRGSRCALRSSAPAPVS